MSIMSYDYLFPYLLRKNRECVIEIEKYLGPCQVIIMELFSENNSFLKKAPSFPTFVSFKNDL